MLNVRYGKRLVKLKEFLGSLSGSVSGASDSWSWGPEFKPYAGCRDYLKKIIIGAPGWLSQLTLDFGSGHDLMVMTLSPTLGSVLGMEPA